MKPENERKLGEDTPNRGNAGKGRPAGSENKLTRTIKEAIEASFEKVGGADYLAKMAMQEPVAYMTLLGKVLPTQVAVKTKEPLSVTFNVVQSGVE
jgi:hypothetical protein